MTRSPQDVGLLLESDGRLRAVLIPSGTQTVLERGHVNPGRTEERIWRHREGDRALTGQRIFRELPAPADAPEQPMYDECSVRFPEDALPPPGSGTRRLFQRGRLGIRRGGRVK